MDSINNVSQGYSSIQSTNECSNIGSKILPNLFNYDGNEFLCDFKAPNRPQCSDELSSGPTAPPPSCCSTSSDQSTNAFPSPGPMKRFRQIYGDQTGQSSICQLHDSKKAAMNWTENWMNAHHHCSEPSTSNSPSIISNGSVVSKLSTVSVDTQLSVAVDLLNLEPNFFQMQSNSFIENVPPCYFQQMQHCLSKILEKLNSMNEIEEFDALCQLYRIGKEHHFIYCTEAGQISEVIQKLVEITLRPDIKQRTKTLTLNVLNKMSMAGAVCLTAIRMLETTDRGFFLNAVILCLRSDMEVDVRYATNILSILFTHTVMGEFFRRQARTQAVVRELMLALKQESYGFRHKFLRHIYYLINSSRELKRFFHQSNGLQFCLDLFQKSVDEPMLYGCVCLILTLIDGLGNTAADHFVTVDGYQILATRLNHGSPRLLQCIARCFALASISDVVAQHSIDDALRFSIQLMGSTDAELAKHMVGFVANVQTKHRGAKEFLQQNKAIPNLVCLLSVWANSIPIISPDHKCEDKSSRGTCKHMLAQKLGIDDIIDTVLLALNNLSNGLNADAKITCRAIMDGCLEAPSILLHLFTSTNRPEIIRIRTLTLLTRIFTHLGPSIFERFIGVYTVDEQKSYPYALLELFFNTMQKLSVTNHENAKDMKTIAYQSLVLLNELMKNQFLLDITISLIRGFNWDPTSMLSLMENQELESCYMEFLCRLMMSSPELLARWISYKEKFRFYANIPHLRHYVIQILNLTQN